MPFSINKIQFNSIQYYDNVDIDNFPSSTNNDF